MGHKKIVPVEESFTLHATLGITEAKRESRILEGKCLRNRP